MKRKIVSVLCIVSMMTAALAGCGSGSNKSDNGYADSINILVWDETYSEEVFDDFEETYGIQVNVSYIENTDEILSKLINGDGDYDMVDIESAYVQSFVENNLLAEIDHDAIPNEENIKEELFSPVGDEENVYTVPAQNTLYTCIIYNTQTCPITIQSFSDLADPALKDDVCLVNSTNTLFGTALESLGYDAASTDEGQMQEAYELLADIKGNVKAFVGGSAVSQLENGDCSVALCWDLPVLMSDESNWDKFAVAEIDSGYESSSCYWGIPADSENAEEAELLMNFMLEPEEHAKSLEEYPADSTLDDDLVKEYLPDDYFDNPAYNMAQSVVDQAWKIAIDDDQISLMDTYYTQLMGN